MNPKIWLSSPHMGGTEQQFVKDAFDENWIAPLGPNVNGFEKDIEEFLSDNVHVAALSSGTSAIHLGLILLGVKSGDEVICQSMTFSASANPIAYLGAKPVFIDSEEDSWNMCPVFLEEAVTSGMRKGKKPRAIIVVHLYGMPAKMPEILAIAEKYDIPVIEDAAEALGSSIQGKKCGTFGKINILSFNGNKIITTSGGGALVSHDEELVKKSRFLATQARDNAPHYQHSEIGYNYRMSNICAGIGRGQMEVITKRVNQRRSNFEYYKEQLNTIPGISFLEEPDGFYSNRWLSTILIDPQTTPNNKSQEDVRLSLEKLNIECRPLWKPMHLQPVFAESPYFGESIAENLFDNGLCLPSGSNLTTENLNTVKKAILHVFN